MTQHQHVNNDVMQKLNDTNLTLADSRQDIRGRKVIDRHGEEIGHVSDLFIDEAERNVRMLQISAGGFLGLGDRHFLLPVDAISTVGKDEVHIDQTREHVVNSPAYDPKLIARPSREYWEPYYGYYGLSPYWGTGYMYPGVPLYPEDHTPGARGLREKRDNGA